MDLTIQDVAKYLQVSEETLLKWVDDGDIPSYTLSGEFRFSREEIEEWVLRHFHNEDLNIETIEPVIGPQHFNLYRALNKGLVLTDVEGVTKEEIIYNSMKLISESLELDAETITNLLLDRERLMSTALNRGVAVPHTRDFLLSGAHDVVAIVYPKKSIEYGALDGKDVHTLFFLFACKDKTHLNLLSKIAYFCHQSENLEVLQARPSKPDLLNTIRHWESKINQLQPANS